MHELILDGQGLTAAQVRAVANGGSVVLGASARVAMDAGVVHWAQHGDPRLLRSKWEQLMGGPAPAASHEAVRRFILDHCAGVGEPLPRDQVRALLVCRAQVLARGVSGCRPVVVERLLELLERDLLPVVPSMGPLGAAGSPALAHLARVALGMGGEVLTATGQAPSPIEPLAVTEKEALSLINGSTLTTALAALAVDRADVLLRTSVAACALSMEVVQADARCLDARAAKERGHPGGIAMAASLRGLLQGSSLVHDKRSPDAFCIRCAPIVLGAAADALDHVRTVVERELSGAGDNPLVFEDGVVEAGHFHGAPVAMVMDHLKVALVQVASIAERRIFRLTYGRLSGLPSFLVPGTGVNSGLMLAQYTAASLVAEARGRAVAGSVDSIPTVQHHEDHVSMGPVAARTALDVVDLVADVLAIELLAGAQGLDFRRAGEAVDADGVMISVEPGEPGAGTLLVFGAVRARVNRWLDDQVLQPDIEVLGKAVRAGVFAELVPCP
jgi:histidine ammonia-lyase